MAHELEEGLLLVVSPTTTRREQGKWRRLGLELKCMGQIAAPMVAVTLSQYGLQVISMMMVGHLGELQLSGAAMATSLASVTGFSLLLGLASGLETLCGQAFGAKQYKKLGLHMYRAIFCLLLVCFPICIIWISMEKILCFVGQDPQISHEAGNYVMWMIPALFAYATVQPMMRFLQSQSLTLPMLISSIATLCLHIPLCWVLVFKTRLHNIGAALSLGISYWLNVFVIGLYIEYSPSCKATHTPFSSDAFKGITEFLKLAIPSAVMICLSSISTLYAIPYGLGAAASTRVANELGAGNPEGARFAMLVAMLVSGTESVILSGTLFGLRSVLGYAYSNEKEVVNYVRGMVPLVCFSVIMDSLQGVLSGVARGCGWQHIGAFVNLGAFYLCGIPIAVVLGFVVHIGGKGLWIGVMAGAMVQTILLATITTFTNWQKQADKARERAVDHLPAHDDSLK